MIEIQTQLNPTQYAAASTIDGPLLVIAGAGSGKTRVIEYRVLHLVQSEIAPSSILLLTFTKRASREMLGRAAKHDTRCERVEGGTFHSFCYKMLRRHAKTIGFNSSFSVLDESDAADAVHRCAAKLGLHDREKRFPKKRTLKGILSMSINKNASIRDVLGRQYPHFIKYAPDIEKLRNNYAEYKIAKNLMDYDDLLVYFRLVLEDEAIRSKIAGKYKYIMVDEYQDTNLLQGDIAYLMAKEHKNIMVVGDDAQSIYGFRGASHDNIMKFPKQFAGCKIMKLEENYRSTQAILDVGNTILENMKNKFSKTLVSARKTRGEKPEMLFFKDAYREAEWIARRIKDLYDEGVELAQQAVLFRNLYISIPLQAELNKRNIPYHVFGGMKFNETAHVKDVIAHLKVIANPKDELSWTRILTLLEGIGPKKAEIITEEIMAAGSIERIVGAVLGSTANKFKVMLGLKKLGVALKSATKKGLSVGEKFIVIQDYYDAILREKFDDWHLRTNDLDTMRQISERYDSLSELLADFAIEPPDKGVSSVGGAQHSDVKPLTVSTIHSAKGLEWEAVFFMGLMDGVLPSKFSVDDEDEIEEEQRLFYVGVTRAKRYLSLSLHHEGNRGGISQFNRVSRFVEAPNVASRLDSSGHNSQDVEQCIDEYLEEDDMLPVYNKESLLKKIVDDYK